MAINKKGITLRLIVDNLLGKVRNKIMKIPVAPTRNVLRFTALYRAKVRNLKTMSI